MGITSVGHRLTILKAIYEVKVKQDIPIESDHYIPLCKQAPNHLGLPVLTPSKLPMPVCKTKPLLKKTSRVSYSLSDSGTSE